MVLYWCILVILITVVLMTAEIAQAGSTKTLKIWPDQLIRTKIDSESYQDPFEVNTGVFYYAFTLPIGAKITNIIYAHYGAETMPVHTRVALCRVRMGYWPEEVAEGESTDSTGIVIQVFPKITGDPIIKKAYQYFIYVESDNYWSGFMGASIWYWVE